MGVSYDSIFIVKCTYLKKKILAVIWTAVVNHDELWLQDSSFVTQLNQGRHWVFSCTRQDDSLHILEHCLLVCDRGPWPGASAVWGAVVKWKSLGTPAVDHRCPKVILVSRSLSLKICLWPATL